MTSDPPLVLTLLHDADLARSAERVTAAVGARAVRYGAPGPRAWLSAAAVVLDEPGAEQCARSRLPRRPGVFLVAAGEPSTSTWSAAVEIGAQRVVVLPEQETELVSCLSDAAEQSAQTRPHRRGPAIAVTAGRGGAGASVFAAALAQSAEAALLVDLDPCGGGIDLLLGEESAPGVRWPDLSLRGGRLAWSALQEVLPRRGGVSVLSAARGYHPIDGEPANAVVDAGRRGGATVVCDLPRHPGQAALGVLERSQLLVVVTSCDLRSIAATAATLGVLRPVNPNVGLVVRGPAPGGLRAAEVAEAVAAPLLAAMRPEPLLDQRLEKSGLRLRRRSPLAGAARTVLAVVHRSPGAWAA